MSLPAAHLPPNDLILRPGDPRDRGGVARELAELAWRRDADPTRAPLASSIAVLARKGFLLAPLDLTLGGRGLGTGGITIQEAVSDLIAIGSGDLSIGRLWEGHLNAIRLISVHGTKAQMHRAARVAQAGSLLGVWGADTANPVTCVGRKISGIKQYCSGLGVVALAVVPVRSGDGQQLLLLDTSDPNRADPTCWNMRGMEATVSGRYDFNGLVVGQDDLLGPADVFTREPWFLGGVWRIAAVELGGVFGLLEAARAMLGTSGRLEDAAQTTRLGECLIAAHTARALAVEAGTFAESPAALDAPERAARLSILARLAAERAAEECLTKVAKSVGLAGFASGSPVDRPMRDLQTYIRQMMPDALLRRASQEILADGRPLAEAFDD